jgi:hypothetical protein
MKSILALSLIVALGVSSLVDLSQAANVKVSFIHREHLILHQLSLKQEQYCSLPGACGEVLHYLGSPDLKGQFCGRFSRIYIII